MTTLEIILIVVLIVVSLSALASIRYFYTAYYEMIEAWLEDRSNVEKAVNNGSFNRILNVEDFNDWFCNNKDKEIYAHPGIFLRLDKLSQHHIQDFISVKSNGMIHYEYFGERKLIDFEKEISKDWRKKKNEL